MRGEHNPRPCSWSSTSATPRPISAPSTATELVERLALRDRARVDRRRARRGAARAARAARPRPSPTSTPPSSPPPSRSCAPEWTAMAEPLPRPRHARRRARACAPACRSGWTTRASSAPTGSSTRSPPTRALGGPCVVVDFGTAITYDLVSARRRVPRRHHRPGRGDLARGAHQPRRRDPARSTSPPPRTLIGKSTVDAIRSGVIFGFAAQVDGIVTPPARGAGGGDARDRHRRPRRGHRPLLHDDRRRRSAAHAHGAAADLERSDVAEGDVRGTSRSPAGEPRLPRCTAR